LREKALLRVLSDDCESTPNAFGVKFLIWFENTLARESHELIESILITDAGSACRGLPGLPVTYIRCSPV